MLIPFPRMGKSLQGSIPASYLTLFQNLHARRPAAYLATADFVGPAAGSPFVEEYADDDGGVIYGYGGEQPMLGSYLGGAVRVGQGQGELIGSDLGPAFFEQMSGKKRALWLGPRLGKRRRRQAAFDADVKGSEHTEGEIEQSGAGIIGHKQ
jgi:hypothetical protein